MTRIIYFIIFSSFLASFSLAHGQQISEGVRVMIGASLNDEQRNEINPAIHPFIILSQPIFRSKIPPESMQKFNNSTDRLQFFARLPTAIRENGLWVTRMRNIPITKSDNDLINSIVDGATGMDLPIFICKGKTATKNVHTGLTAWECNMEFPRKGEQFICEPSDEVKAPGLSLWNCTNNLAQ